MAAISVSLVVVVSEPHSARAADVPGTTCSVFPADNIWNTDISNVPVNPMSATWIANTMPSSGLTHPDFGGPPYGIPFNVVGNSHARASITFDYASESDPGPYPWGNDLAIEGPTDSHMLVIDKDTCTLYETFATDIPSSHAGSGAIFDLGSDALRPVEWTSADAAGLPIFPGLVRLDEVQAGFIGHAIRFTVHNTDDTYLWPARHHAGINQPNLPPMGARFRLKAGYDISSFGAEAQVVLTAFKHYGLIVADNGSDWYFQGTEDAGWDDTVISDLKKIPVNEFEAVDESSLMTNPDSASAGTVPVTPAAPTAAPGDARASVSWAAPAGGGHAITGYTVTGSPAGHAVAGGSATSAIVYGLTNGVSYTFTVRATNVVGTGLASPASNAVVPMARIVSSSSGGTPPPRTGVHQSTNGSGAPRVPARGVGAPAPSPVPRAAAGGPAAVLPRGFYLRF